VNPKQCEARIVHADHIRARALHDLTRARMALDTIREIAEARTRADALQVIACIARAALAGSTPPDPSLVQGEEHDRESR